MKAKKSDWYKNIWSLDIKNQSWVEDTERQVDFIISTLGLKGTERILDLACGYGRHALSFAKKGFDVVGIDITKEYVDDAKNTAAVQDLNALFIHSDIRSLRFEAEFDVVLNLADGAIGYLEDDDENLKIFDVISKALKPGGKHFMDICSADHARLCFPKSSWQAGEESLALSLFEWNEDKKIMLYGGCNLPYGLPVKKPEFLYGDPIRLYSLEEITDRLSERNMTVKKTFSDYYGKKYGLEELQLMVFSQKL